MTVPPRSLGAPWRASTALLAVLALGALGTGQVSAQTVVPDGHTNTTVTTGAGGVQTIVIAPTMPNSTISHNTYDQFSVGTPGVNFDNTNVKANTIVNEVTSTKRSYLLGPMDVLGQTAHLIIVNPNGVTVDGASFHNVGGVVLSGGSVSYATSLISPGQMDAIVRSGSDIEVTGKGLSGAMPTLQLLAQKIKIDGPVTNTLQSPNADIALNAGNTELTLDSSVQAGTTLKPWAKAKSLT